MKNWAATKSRGHTEISRRIERGILVNKFRDVAYSQAAKTFSERQGTLQKDIPSFEVYQRSKSSHQKKNHFEG